MGPKPEDQNNGVVIKASINPISLFCYIKTLPLNVATSVFHYTQQQKNMMAEGEN